ncbi:MAG: DUF1858 domain-containing protein [Clostridium sp.]|nr:DUF1858 domain-containing protein [Clostridium sp.]
MEFEKTMTIGEILKAKPDVFETLMSFGMGCVGCPASQMETLEEAAMVHGLDVNDILTAINK